MLHGHGEIIFFQRKLNFEVNLNNNLESTKLLCFAFSLNLNHENMQDITNNLKRFGKKHNKINYMVLTNFY